MKEKIQLTYEDVCLLLGVLELTFETDKPSPIKQKLQAIAQEIMP